MSVKKYADANGLSEFWNNIKTFMTRHIYKACPIGKIDMFAGSVAPNGWLLCDGSAISRSVYSGLFEVIGTIYGDGDGETTFNLPDMRGRMPIGSDSTYELGNSGGNSSISYTPTGSIGDTKLTDEQMAHEHEFTQPKIPNHTHSFTQPTVPKHTHGFTQPTVPKHTHGFTQPTVKGGGHQHGFYQHDNAGSGSAYVVATSATAVKHSLHYVNSDGGHTHSVSGGAVSEKAAVTCTGGAVSEKAAVACTGGAVGNPSSLPACTGGAVSDLSGASSTRTAHGHSWTGTQSTLNTMSPYKVVNFIIYSGV